MPSTQKALRVLVLWCFLPRPGPWSESGFVMAMPSVSPVVYPCCMLVAPLLEWRPESDCSSYDMEHIEGRSMYWAHPGWTGKWRISTWWVVKDDRLVFRVTWHFHGICCKNERHVCSGRMRRGMEHQISVPTLSLNGDGLRKNRRVALSLSLWPLSP